MLTWLPAKKCLDEHEQGKRNAQKDRGYLAPSYVATSSSSSTSAPPSAFDKMFCGSTSRECVNFDGGECCVERGSTVLDIAEREPPELHWTSAQIGLHFLEPSKTCIEDKKYIRHYFWRNYGPVMGVSISDDGLDGIVTFRSVADAQRALQTAQHEVMPGKSVVLSTCWDEAAAENALHCARPIVGCGCRSFGTRFLTADRCLAPCINNVDPAPISASSREHILALDADTREFHDEFFKVD
eukprot:gnl/MRDRNA2_/MRDRNA2_76328_c0_seq1.p1 gnl/MRDRNA2_/MRDRNA2_76328_c0~~gnl/MRDRNA2_/MRDRNA2_76328_c0_seq1.p1  ORF type:complete len:241 (+),score=36.92 gnl/MRDRNA2_/MRDRNA2_76328_c0_seq1:154-876(+)